MLDEVLHHPANEKQPKLNTEREREREEGKKLHRNTMVLGGGLLQIQQILGVAKNLADS
jgi:hypothetical protein